jgi:hypothetical protein
MAVYMLTRPMCGSGISDWTWLLVGLLLFLHSRYENSVMGLMAIHWDILPAPAGSNSVTFHQRRGAVVDGIHRTRISILSR